MEDDNNSSAILIWKNIFILKWKKNKKHFSKDTVQRYRPRDGAIIVRLVVLFDL